MPAPAPASRPLRVGLTGGIGSGKSYVLGRLSEAGLATLDLDVVAHEVMAPGGPAYEAVAGAFGPSVLAPGGGIDRRALGRVVFRDAEARRLLESIVHPHVRAEEERRVVAAATRGEPVVVSDAALLVEAGLHLRFDRLVVVHCVAEAQLERLRERGLTDEEARARLAAQMPPARKRRFAHFEVDTSGTFAQTDAATARLAGRLRDLAARRPAAVAVDPARAGACLVRAPRPGPRGLGALRLARAMVAAGGPDLPRLAQALEPPSAGPWYCAAERAAPGAGPEALVPALVIWALATRGRDQPYLNTAVASLVMLTHGDDAEAESAAVLFALALEEVGAGAALDRALVSRLGAWEATAAERSGVRPPRPLMDAVRAAMEEPSAPGSPGVAGALAALAGRYRAAEVSADVLDTAQRLVSLPAPA